MTVGSRFILRPRHKFGIAAAALGATYLYYKQPSNPTHTVPYIPPPFVWSSIPRPILKKFTLPPKDDDQKRNGFVWRTMSTMVMGGAGLVAKGFLNSSQTKVVGLEGFVKMIEDPQRKKGIITGNIYVMELKKW
jgi:monolysocardiolipin acyltransferase